MKSRMSTVRALCLLLVFTAPLLAQKSGTEPAAATAPAQAPDDMTKKITELVHAGKYVEARQLTTGLLVAYPNDERLIKVKTLIDRLLASSAPSTVSETAPLAHSDTGTPAGELSGMERIDYNTLVELAREAQQTTDLEQQTILLERFMNQSSGFLQKHPDQMLLWQLRAISAISLEDASAGYEAGQRLMAADAANSSDPALQRLLARLNAKGWLGESGAAAAKQQIESKRKQAELNEKYAWIWGTWNEAWKRRGRSASDGEIEFKLAKSAPVIEGRLVRDGSTGHPTFRGTVLDSGELRWEIFNRTTSGWIQVRFEIDKSQSKMTMVFPNSNDPITWTFTRNGGKH